MDRPNFRQSFRLTQPWVTGKLRRFRKGESVGTGYAVRGEPEHMAPGA